MIVEISKISCGIRLIHGLHLSEFKDFLAIREQDVTKNPDSSGYMSCFRKDWTYLFSDNKYGEGASIAKYIKDNNLGEITDQGWWKNPNTLTDINLWIWKYNGNKVSKVKTASKSLTKGFSL